MRFYAHCKNYCIRNKAHLDVGDDRKLLHREEEKFVRSARRKRKLQEKPIG